MMCYGSKTPKRSSLWCNKKGVAGFATGKLPKNRGEIRLVKIDVRADGKRSWTGNKNLKQSQS